MTESYSDTQAIEQLRRADELIARGRLGDAMDTLRRVLGARPDLTAMCQFQIGRIHLVESRPQEALQCAQRAVEASPDNSLGHFLAGLAFRTQGRAHDSARAFAEAVRLDPDDADMHAALAQALEDIGQHQAAFREADIAVRLEPDDADNHFAMGYVLHGHSPMAIKAYLKALELDPENTEAKNNLAALSANSGNHKVAAEGFAEVLAADPQARLPLMMLDELLANSLAWTHRLTLACFVVLCFASFASGAVQGIIAFAVCLVGMVLFVAFSTRHVRKALPYASWRHVAEFLRRDPAAGVWAAILVLFWLIWLVVLVLDVTGVVPELRVVGGLTFLLLIAGIVVSWLRAWLATRRLNEERVK